MIFGAWHMELRSAAISRPFLIRSKKRQIFLGQLSRPLLADHEPYIPL